MSDEKKESGLLQFQNKVLALCEGNKEVKGLIEKYADLEMDYDYVKNMNTQLSFKYDELMNCFPTSDELDYLIAGLETESIKKIKYSNEIKKIKYSNEIKNERLSKLVKFRSALICLEAQDTNQIPADYDDIVKKE